MPPQYISNVLRLTIFFLIEFFIIYQKRRQNKFEQENTDMYEVNVGLHDFMNISPKRGEPIIKWMFHSSFSNRNDIIITSSSTPNFLTNEITVISVPPYSHSSQKLNFLEHWALLIDYPSMNCNPISSPVIFQVAPSLMNSFLDIKIKWNSGVRTTFYSTWALWWIQR